MLGCGIDPGLFCAKVVTQFSSTTAGKSRTALDIRFAIIGVSSFQGANDGLRPGAMYGAGYPLIRASWMQCSKMRVAFPSGRNVRMAYLPMAVLFTSKLEIVVRQASCF